MKKIFAVCLCLAMTLILFACTPMQNQSAGSVKPAPSVPAQSASANTTASTAVQTASPSPSASERTSVDVDYTYKGESADWQGEYHVWGTVIYRNAENVWVTGTTQNTFTATYKKDVSHLAKVKKLQIRLKTKTNNAVTTYDYSKSVIKDTVFKAGGGCSDGNPDRKEALRVTVSLDGKPQVFDLKCE